MYIIAYLLLRYILNACRKYSSPPRMYWNIRKTLEPEKWVE